jgi:hypothetical protein
MSYNGPERASDPWEHADPSYAQIDLGYQSGYYDSPPQRTPSQGGSRALLAVLVTVLVLVLCGGGVAALYLLGGRGGQPTGGPTTAASGSPTASTSPKFDPATITVGQCLAISGPKEKPVVDLGSCDAGHYKVVKRIDGTADGTQCKGITTWNYFYDTTPDENDFVLCLQKL